MIDDRDPIQRAVDEAWARCFTDSARSAEPTSTELRLERENENLRQRLAAAEAAARWLWPKVSDDAYDAAWEKWPWLDSESAKGGRDA